MAVPSYLSLLLDEVSSHSLIGLNPQSDFLQALLFTLNAFSFFVSSSSISSSQVLHPFYIFQLCSIVLWSLDE